MSAARPYLHRAGIARTVAPRFPVSRKRQAKIWWREIDRVLLALVLLLMALGWVAVAAASPASAQRLSGSAGHLPQLYFFWLHVCWQVIGLAVLLVTSALPRQAVRRGAILFGCLMLLSLVLVPFIGSEVNGARRWLDLGIRFQPSEFLKPPFAVCTAWMLSWRLRDPHLPVIAISGCLLAFIIVLVMLQPNLGSAILFVGCWFVMVLLAGLPLQRVGIFAGAGVALLVATYAFYDNARNRIDAFLGGGTEFDQVDLASRTLLSGGWNGTGLWLGTQKMRLPEAHTDYIFSVIGEEFGLLMCGVMVLLYLAIALRVLVRLVEEDNLFTILAASGLVTLFCGQAFINMMVNLQLFPSKGMTLPLVSYGGSSTIAQCFLIGLLLAITRRNPFVSREGIDMLGVPGRGARL